VPVLTPTLAEKLEICALEVIHSPGSIQTFAALLAGSTSDYSITYVSQNSAEFIKSTPQELLRKSLPQALPKIFDLINKADAESKEKLVTFSIFDLQKEHLQVNYQERNGVWILQIENASKSRKLKSNHWSEIFQKISLGRSVERSGQIACESLRKALGYDRIILYRFHPTWDGEVVAESTAKRNVEFKGLFFPASDIPSQARALYLRERLRMIVDVDSIPAPLVSNDSTSPLDLTGCIARTVSPIHCEYLRNMGVKASLALSLVVDGKLWGMLSCHHYNAKTISIFDRESALMLAEFLSSHLANIEVQTAVLKKITLHQNILDISANIKKDRPKNFFSAGNFPHLIHPINTQGIALLAPSETIVRGLCPSPNFLIELKSYLEKQDADFFTTENYSTLNIAYGDEKSKVAGFLAVRYGFDAKKWLVFFRKEWIQEVFWGGDPNKSMTIDLSGKISPRKSFQAWQEIRKGLSRPWDNEEIQYAKELALSLSYAQILDSQSIAKERFISLEERLQGLVSSLPDIIQILSLDGIYIQQNNEFTCQTMPRSNFIIGKHYAHVVPESILTQLQSSIKKLLARKTVDAFVAVLSDFASRTFFYEYRIRLIGSKHILLVIRDITAQRSAEQERMLMSSIADKTQSLAIITNKEFQVQWTNTAFKDFNKDETPELESMTLFSLLSYYQCEPQVLTKIQNSIQHIESFNSELIITPQNGKPLWVLAEGYPLLHTDGSLQNYVVLLKNINDRKLNEVKTSNELQFIQDLLEVSLSGFWDWDIAKNRIFLSPKLCSLFGYEESEFSNDPQKFMGIIFMDDTLIMLRTLEQHVQSRGQVPFRCELRCQHKNGEVVWVICAGRVSHWTQDGSPLRIIGCHLNISKSKETEISLRQTLDKYEKTSLLVKERDERIATIAEKLSGALYQFQIFPDGRCCFPYTSESFEDILGIPSAEVRHNISPIYKMIHPNDLTRLLESIEYSQKNLTPFESEHRHQHPTKGMRYIYAALTPALQEDNSVLWHGHLFDITNRRLAEDLEKKEEKRKAIETMAGGLAHDFNNYLGSIQAAVNMLEKELGSAPASVQELTQLILFEVKAAQHISQQLLSLSKEQPLNLNPISVEKILRDSCNFCLAGTTIRKHLDVQDSSLCVLADHGYLQQILVNLILNAREAMETNGLITLKASSVKNKYGSKLVHISITDNGSGIPPEIQDNVFTPFFTSKKKGSGLGLYIVKTHIERMRGTISFTSSPENGTCFNLFLPAALAGDLPSVKTPVLKTIALTGAQKRILILEDNKSLQKIMSEFLRYNDFITTSFPEGQELLTWLDVNPSFSPYACVLDMTIPGGLGGADIVFDLRLKYPACKIIFTSGYSQETSSEWEKIKKLKVHFLPKPYEMKDLVHKILHEVEPG